MYLLKLAQTINMTLDVPLNEKKTAANTVLYFEKLLNKLNAFNTLLDKMYEPFKAYQTISEDSINNYRQALWNYSKEIKESFDDINDLAVLCVSGLNKFQSDAAVSDLTSAVVDNLNDLEDEIKELTDNISAWDDPEYKTSIVNSMDTTKLTIDEIIKLVTERVIDHINTNILAKSWMDKLDESNNKIINDNEPAIKRLFKERLEKLKDLA